MIKLAMLWFEPNKNNTVLQTIYEALDFYVAKYGHQPNIVAVNPKEFDPEVQYPVQVVPWKYTLPGHIFVGLSDDRFLQHQC